MIVGYSSTYQLLLIQMQDMKQYLYKDVPEAVWVKLKTYTNPSKTYATEVKGNYRFENVEYLIKEESIESMIAEYNDLLHFHDSSLGLMCTDRADLVIDEQGVMFQLK